MRPPRSRTDLDLDRLKREGVVRVRREGTFLRYMVSARALEDLLQFLFAECCPRTGAITPARFVTAPAGPASRGSDSDV